MRQIAFGSVAGLAVLMACALEPDQVPTGLSTLEAPIVADQAAAQATGHQTHLTGDGEVPTNASRGQGNATFRLSADGESLHYRLVVANIENVTMAHIHLGPADDTGPVVAWLYPSGPPPELIPGRTQGVLGEGMITAASLMGPLEGMTLDDLMTAIADGNTYVNVHTELLPPGEIRGQID
jgi:hypothetical protein